MTLLRIQDLRIGFPGRPAVVDGVSLTLAAGERYCLLGESGSGKTLTALAVPQLLPANAMQLGGCIEVNGVAVNALSASALTQLRGGTVGYVFQEPQSALNPVMRVGEQVAEAVRRHSLLRGRGAREAATELLTRVGIQQPEQAYDQYPHQFSGGMKQRALIAMAIAGRPQLLIADEPTTALDVSIQAQILNLLVTLCEQDQLGLLFITHDLGVARQVAERIAVMQNGRIVEEATVDALFSQPQAAATQALFAAWPRRSMREARAPSTRAAAPVLVVDQLEVSYPGTRPAWWGRAPLRQILSAVDFTLAEGETLAVVGESGSGKTTLARALTGLVCPSKGSIRLNGQELLKASARAWRAARPYLQIVFQDPFASMNPRMDIEHIVGEGLLALGLESDQTQRRARIVRVLNEVGLAGDVLSRYPHEFSGGQRQRICIARALVLEPKVLICDEPTSALDAAVQWQILQLLRGLQARTGMAYLFITHNFSVVEYFADRVLVMHQGRVVETGPVEQILDRPQLAYTRELLRAVPRF